MTDMVPPAGESLFEELFAAAARGVAGEGEGAELFERSGAALELSEDDEGGRLLVSHERGFALRLFRSGRVGFAASGPEEARGLGEAARRVLPGARARRGARAAPLVPGDRREGTPAALPSLPSEETARSLLADFRRLLGRFGEGAVTLQEVTVTLGVRSERIATTAGRDATWTSQAAALVATVTGRSGGATLSARLVTTAARPEELPVARFARYATDRVLLPLEGHPLEAGRWDLLLDGQVAAHLVGRLAPLFLGDEGEELLLARTRGGRDPLAAPLLSLVDDAGVPGGPVRTARDAEGTPQARHVVLGEGLPAGRLTDVAAASRRGALSSGNAVRRAWSEPPSIGVTNFFVDPSAGRPPLALVSGTARGFYAAVLLEKPSVDVAADRFRLQVGGYHVERGRASARISDAVLAGRISELLRRVEAVGDDLGFVPGAGGGVGSPTLYVPRWKCT